ncbi:hypothetical protein CJO78_12670 [Ralstonia solanacearum]|nr:hypothetical protein CJO78_12670 [Ralstonia solanacearum]AXW06576.1 hypothetical protein CJO82_12450 [Ralstonia solanacearum]AXW24319.1 hypothetical protein CJO86_12450 [Ralstonia solanacearum]AXW81254.1 hypothetical protein CJO98_12685 [Ralstonia solanacearum]
MSHLGSECQNGLIYEGRDNPSHLAVPTPIISQCALVRPGFQGATYRLIHISVINSLGERICAPRPLLPVVKHFLYLLFISRSTICPKMDSTRNFICYAWEALNTGHS